MALVVHWSSRPEVSRSVSELLTQVRALGYQVALCSAAETPGPLAWPHGIPNDAAVYRRPNVGYDFGSWASMLHAFPVLMTAPRTLLINDSMVGPFRSIAPVLERFEADDCDVWGLVNTTMAGLHLQSHFVGYKNGALSRRPLRRFWGDVRLEPTKWDLILRYEVGLYRVLEASGFRVGVGFPYDLVVNPGQNPTITGWRRLLLHGFPWVKRELLLRPPAQAPDAEDVPAVVRSMFGEAVEDWY